MKSTQLITERAMEIELFKEKQVFQNKNKLFYSCKNFVFLHYYYYYYYYLIFNIIGTNSTAVCLYYWY